MFVVLSHEMCGNVLQQPQETSTEAIQAVSRQERYSNKDDSSEGGEMWSSGLILRVKMKKNSFLELIEFATLLSSRRKRISSTINKPRF